MSLLHNLPMFGFPRGIRIDRSYDRKRRKPKYSHFVLTNEENTILHCTKLIYYTKVLTSKALPLSLTTPSTRFRTINEEVLYQPPSLQEQAPEQNFVSKIHHALWTGVIKHRSSLAIVTRRYCVINDTCITCHKLLTSSQVASNKSLLGTWVI